LAETWIPTAAKPAFRCGLCGKGFLKRERHKYQRHVVGCAKRHRSEIEVASGERRARIDADPFQGAFDPEAEAFVRKHGRA